MEDKYFLSNNITLWLEKIIKERISNDIFLNKEIRDNNLFWALNLKNSKYKLNFLIIEKLYKTEFDPNFENHIWKLEFDENKYNLNNLICPGLKFKNNFKMVLSFDKLSVFNYDPLGLIYWMFTRCEEVNLNKELLDEHGRFPSKLSHSYKFNYYKRPIVDEWIFFLRKFLKIKIPEIRLSLIKTNINITHDVDRPSRFEFSTRKDFLKLFLSLIFKQHQYNEALSAIYIRIFKNKTLKKFDSNNTFNFLMDVSEEFGFKSIFYFISGGNNYYYDGDYLLKDIRIENLLSLIYKRGHYIGLHPSYDSFHSLKKVKTEFLNLQNTLKKLKINQINNFNRMHYLKWRWPMTPNILQKIGINEDSTLGFPDLNGFRCGTSHSFKMFDPVVKKELNLIQKPLIVMDSSLINDSFIDLNKENKIIKNVKKLYFQTKKYGGFFTILWHNDSLRTKKQKDLYYKIIKMLVS